jgi:hypothetical protein
LLGFQARRRIVNQSCYEKWPNSTSNIEDDAYETPILTYNKKMDLLILAISIIKSDMWKRKAPHHT